MNLHDYEFTRIDGEPLPLEDFAGKAVLVVNVASECGYTPQYKGLQQLHGRFADRGLVVLGVPSNDFGGQEPGSEPEIASFCSATFGVTFPMTEKVAVTGEDAHPLYRDLVAELGDAAAPRWNFHKYLFDGEGNLVWMWPAPIEPEAPELIERVEGTLG